ncbi:outer membrane beta-barrel protein [Geobacter sp. AOG1]|uniref:outer membrane beta-barrel protein n=1 Tax=Geobacter sp. AOG1 TaxID=1566346 RepID=UPI001CC70FEB|nr:outer membrane beta-barrel protein [Geobacter sp. AOG1]GFE57636.1 outer membrane protein [Geobacter sp. AOG1]
MRIIISCILSLVLLTSTAMAESINGRLGLTGKLGFTVPLKDLEVGGAEIGEHETGFAGGGGLIYGLGDNFALELDVTHAPATDIKINKSKVAEQQTTDISVGLQYRLMPEHRLVPYVGAGADFIKGDITNSDIDWTYGGHASLGADYFITKSIVATVDFRFVAGSKSDILLNGSTIGRYDPMSFIGTFGVRLFLPKTW